MLSDGTAADTSSYNYWGSKGINNAVNTLVVPIGIFGVTDVWTMLENQWGTLGGNDTTLTFNYGTSSNQASGYTQVVVALDNNNGTTGFNGQLNSAVSCTTSASECSTTTSPVKSVAATSVINGVTVNTATIYSSSYTNATGVYYGGTAGKVRLNDQQFVLPSVDSDLWLVSISVTENDANSPQSATALGNGTLPSETALSAITVDNNSALTPTPEPTTILLLLSGLGAIGFRRLRRN
jgi:hypothetical protein